MSDPESESRSQPSQPSDQEPKAADPESEHNSDDEKPNEEGLETTAAENTDDAGADTEDEGNNTTIPVRTGGKHRKDSGPVWELLYSLHAEKNERLALARALGEEEREASDMANMSTTTVGSPEEIMAIVDRLGVKDVSDRKEAIKSREKMCIQNIKAKAACKVPITVDELMEKIDKWKLLMTDKNYKVNKKIEVERQAYDNWLKEINIHEKLKEKHKSVDVKELADAMHARHAQRVAKRDEIRKRWEDAVMKSIVAESVHARLLEKGFNAAAQKLTTQRLQQDAQDRIKRKRRIANQSIRDAQDLAETSVSFIADPPGMEPARSRGLDALYLDAFARMNARRVAVETKMEEEDQYMFDHCVHRRLQNQRQREIDARDAIFVGRRAGISHTMFPPARDPSQMVSLKQTIKSVKGLLPASDSSESDDGQPRTQNRMHQFLVNDRGRFLDMSPKPMREGKRHAFVQGGASASEGEADSLVAPKLKPDVHSHQWKCQQTGKTGGTTRTTKQAASRAKTTRIAPNQRQAKKIGADDVLKEDEEVVPEPASDETVPAPPPGAMLLGATLGKSKKSDALFDPQVIEAIKGCMDETKDATWLYKKIDVYNYGVASGEQFVQAILKMGTGLDTSDVERFWQMMEPDHKGQLNKSTFINRFTGVLLDGHWNYKNMPRGTRQGSRQFLPGVSTVSKVDRKKKKEKTEEEPARQSISMENLHASHSSLGSKDKEKELQSTLGNQDKDVAPVQTAQPDGDGAPEKTADETPALQESIQLSTRKKGFVCSYFALFPDRIQYWASEKEMSSGSPPDGQLAFTDVLRMVYTLGGQHLITFSKKLNAQQLLVFPSCEILQRWVEALKKFLRKSGASIRKGQPPIWAQRRLEVVEFKPVAENTRKNDESTSTGLKQTMVGRAQSEFPASDRKELNVEHTNTRKARGLARNCSSTSLNANFNATQKTMENVLVAGTTAQNSNSKGKLRLAMISNIFGALDPEVDEGGKRLGIRQLQRFAWNLGFRSSLKAWATEYRLMCIANGWEAGRGVSFEQFKRYMAANGAFKHPVDSEHLRMCLNNIGSRQELLSSIFCTLDRSSSGRLQSGQLWSVSNFALGSLMPICAPTIAGWAKQFPAMCTRNNWDEIEGIDFNQFCDWVNTPGSAGNIPTVLLNDFLTKLHSYSQSVLHLFCFLANVTFGTVVIDEISLKGEKLLPLAVVAGVCNNKQALRDCLVRVHIDNEWRDQQGSKHGLSIQRFHDLLNHSLFDSNHYNVLRWTVQLEREEEEL